MSEIIVAFVVATFFTSVCLWAGMKLTGVNGTFIAMLVIAVITALLGLIPTIGWIVGSITMFILICIWTNADFWPDAVLMVVVSRVVGILGGMVLAGLPTKL